MSAEITNKDYMYYLFSQPLEKKTQTNLKIYRE